MRMSIWNFPVLGWEKWFLAVLIMCAGPAGEPISACITRVEMPCSCERRVEKSVQALAEESEV